MKLSIISLLTSRKLHNFGEKNDEWILLRKVFVKQPLDQKKDTAG
jgi:hypothetical protein